MKTVDQMTLEELVAERKRLVTLGGQLDQNLANSLRSDPKRTQWVSEKLGVQLSLKDVNKRIKAANRQANNGAAPRHVNTPGGGLLPFPPDPVSGLHPAQPLPEFVDRFDFFAGLAMHALISTPNHQFMGEEGLSMNETCQLATEWAETMLDTCAGDDGEAENGD